MIKRISKRITSTCDNCKVLLRKADTFRTTNETPNRNLCRKCFSEWLGIDLTGVRL